MVALFASIVFGGTKRLGKTAEIIVPFMAIAYILVVFIVLALNISEVPKMFTLIFKSAFGAEQAFAGILGAGGFIVSNIPKIPIGPGYTQAAVGTVMGSLGGTFVSIALFFFAFTTLMAYYYIAETNLTYLFKNSKYSKIMINLLRVGILAAILILVKNADLWYTINERNAKKNKEHQVNMILMFFYCFTSVI